MRKCNVCNIEKPYSEFYKNEQMADGYLKRCKSCVKMKARERELALKSTPEGLAKDRARHREKYYRLNYKDKHKPCYEEKKKVIERYNNKYPEKLKARNLTSHIRAGKGNHIHHWSYNDEHMKDVFILSIKNHNELHRFIEYDQPKKMYRDLEGNLLDTREKHEEYMNIILS